MTSTCATDRLRHERDEARAELARLRDELAGCEAKADIATQVAGVTHDVATPVGIALMAASLLREHAERMQAALDSGQLKKQDLKAFLFLADESADIMLSNIGRAAELLQAFKQVTVDQLAPIRRRYLLAQYLDELLRSMKPQLRKKAVTATLISPPAIAMEGPAGVLAQIMTNLIANALIHAFEGRHHGAITVSVNEPDENSVELRVSDDGWGIPAEVLPAIFEPFFTTRRGHGGSGLGLHMVRRLVERDLGGSVAVASREGQGTTFTLCLPRLAPR